MRTSFLDDLIIPKLKGLVIPTTITGLALARIVVNHYQKITYFCLANIAIGKWWSFSFVVFANLVVNRAATRMASMS